MSIDGQGTLWRRNIAENFNRLSRAHERYRQTTDRQTTDDRWQTDGRWHIANMNLSSRSLKTDNLAYRPTVVLKLGFCISLLYFTRPVDDLTDAAASWHHGWVFHCLVRLTLTSRLELSPVLPCRLIWLLCAQRFCLWRARHAKGRTGVKHHRQAVHKDLESLTMC